jgi:magnesium and cobalt exporter, CNNM family
MEGGGALMDDYFFSHFFLLSFLVVFSMFFAAVETSLLSFPRSQLHVQAQRPGPLGMAFKEWQDHPNRILTSILIGTNITNIAATTIAAYMAIHLSDLHGWSRTVTGTVASVAVTVVIIVFGDAIPKLAGRTYSIRASAWLVIPVVLFDRMLSPLTWLLARTVSRLFPGLEGSSVALVTEEDIKHMIDLGQLSGTILEGEKRMIQSIFEFTDTKVGRVMIPRTEMFCVEIHTPLERLLDLVVQNGYSRMPVFKENLDNIVGVLHSRDLLALWRDKDLIVLQDLLRKPYFVPETMRVDRLLQEFRKGKIHMAIVVDEYGGTAGLVTLEDLVEEIIGEIREEYESEEDKAISRQEDGSWVVEADLSLDEVNDALGLKLIPKGEVASLGGYLIEAMGKLPKKGRVLEDKEAVFKVLEASEKSVGKVKVTKRKAPLPPLSADREAPAPKPRRRRAKTPAVENAPPAQASSSEMPSEKTDSGAGGPA